MSSIAFDKVEFLDRISLQQVTLRFPPLNVGPWVYSLQDLFQLFRMRLLSFKNAIQPYAG